MKVNLFLDGAYTGKIIKQSGVAVDIHKLAILIAEGNDISNAYYYNCLPWLSEKSPPEELVLFNKVQRFYQILQRIPKFQVKLGKLVKHNGIFIQKGVDTMIAADMMASAIEHTDTGIILVSGDRDFNPVVESIIKMGRKVTVWDTKNHKSPSNYRMLDKELFNKVIMNHGS